MSSRDDRTFLPAFWAAPCTRDPQEIRDMGEVGIKIVILQATVDLDTNTSPLPELGPDGTKREPDVTGNLVTEAALQGAKVRDVAVGQDPEA